VGDEFDGVITAVTSFGLFVELSDLYIEGLVHITALPGDYYHFDKATQRLTGERSARSFQLGGAVRVQVARVDLDDRKIDLEMIESKQSGKKSKKQSGKPSKKPSKKKPRKKAASGGEGKGANTQPKQKKSAKQPAGKTGHRRRR